ncbi:unnamed protein product [Rotaria sp. Silwood1]|nr:unnamed protein product [Rotaria sp. Silwood1]
MTSIRLIHITILSTDKLLTFQSFLYKIFWSFVPVLPTRSKRNEWPIQYYFILIVAKLLINDWIYRWISNCGTRVTYESILMLYVYLISISYIVDAIAVIVRILTLDKYTLESCNDFPIFSLSLREFWGQRYNRWVGTIFKESIFEPIRSEFSSSTIGGLTTFIVSGLFHVHAAYVTFGDISTLFPSFMFFFLHALKSLAKKAKELKATVHLPRIGVGSQGFNWYGTEKLIKKYLSSRGISTYIYYFKRESATTNNKRSNEQSYGNNKRLSIEKGINNINRLKLHMPSYLSGIHVFFHDIDENTKKRLQRFVYAFDGDIDETADANTTTHILAAGNCQDILALQDACPNARVINIEWLDACISNGTRLNTDIYEL